MIIINQVEEFKDDISMILDGHSRYFMSIDALVVDFITLSDKSTFFFVLCFSLDNDE